MSMWDHLRSSDVSGIPPGLCGCDTLKWSAAHPRPHDPAVCARWRKMVVTQAKADELRAWIEGQ